MQIDLRVIQTFVAVVDSGSVIGASRMRGFSAAAVSRQIAGLQRRLGVRLFEREGRSIRPTQAALELATHSRALLDAAQVLDAYARSMGPRQGIRAHALHD